MKIQLNKFQLFLLMFIMQTGFVYTSFQTLVIEHSGRDSTIQFFVVASLFFLQFLLFERMHTYFVLRKFTKALYLIYWSVYIIAFVVYLTYVLSTWVFINTPNSVLIAIFLSVCFYASISRPETAVNIGVVLIPMLILFVIFMFRAIPNLKLTNLLPLLHDPKSTWALGFLYVTYAFTGAEVYLVLRKYVLKNEKINNKIISIYFGILTFFYFIPGVFTLMYFSLDEINLIPEPIFYILHSLEVTFVKRLDLFFIYIWLSWSLVAIVNFVLVMRLVYFEKNQKKPKLQLFIFFFVVGVTATFLTRYSVVDFLKHYLVYVSVLFSILLPILIILVNKLRGKKVSESNQSS